MMRLAIKSTLFALIVVGSMAVLNYAIDPARLFTSRDYERTIAEHFLRGEDLAEIADYDERLVQKFYVEKLVRPPEVLILGSSRSMQMSSKSFPGSSFYNASVTGPTLEDHIAIYGLYASSKKLPKSVIMCLDPWMLTNQSGWDRWKSLYREYVVGAQHAGLDARYSARADLYYRLRRFASLLSPNYFQTSLAMLSEGRFGGGYHVRRPGDSSDGAVRYSDGSYDYEKSRNERPMLQVHVSAVRYAAQMPRYVIEDGLAQAFQRFVSAIRRDGVNVVFYLPPYNPATYTNFDASTRNSMERMEQYIRGFARERAIRVIGSYDPSQTGYAESDFVDGDHVRMQVPSRYLGTLNIFGRNTPLAAGIPRSRAKMN